MLSSAVHSTLGIHLWTFSAATTSEDPWPSFSATLLLHDLVASTVDKNGNNRDDGIYITHNSKVWS